MVRLKNKLLKHFFSGHTLVFFLKNKVEICRGYQGVGGLFFNSEVWEYQFSSEDNLSEIFSRICVDSGARLSDQWLIGLPLKYFSLVNFSLPEAALENLNDAVNYSLMRHIPYDPEEGYMSYVSVKRNDHVDINALFIPSQEIEVFTDAATQNGIILHGLFPSILYWASLKGDGLYVHQDRDYGEILVVQDQQVIMNSWGDQASSQEDFFLNEGKDFLSAVPKLSDRLFIWGKENAQEITQKLEIHPRQSFSLSFSEEGFQNISSFFSKYGISILPDHVRKQRLIETYLMYGGIAVFVLSLLLWPVFNIAGQKRNLSLIEERIRTLESRAEELLVLRGQSSDVLEEIKVLADIKDSYPEVLNILRELTLILPESSWVTSLICSSEQISIQGETMSATSVIEALERSSMFRDVKFSSPVTRSADKDKFALTAEVVL